MMMTMVPFALPFFLFVASAQPAAYVDLTTPLKAPSSYGPASARVKGGGLLEGPGKFSNTIKSGLPVSLKVVRIVEGANHASGEAAVEVLLTNTSTRPIRIPVGVEETALLKPPAPERRYLAFAVWAGGDDAAAAVVGTAQAACNGEHPETTMELQPGNSVSFKLPFDRRTAAYRTNGLAEHGLVQSKLSASVELYRMEADKDGDYSEVLSPQIKSENSLEWSATPR